MHQISLGASGRILQEAMREQKIALGADIVSNQAASEEMYSHANAAGADPAAGAQPGAGASSQPAGDNITDADFEEVK